MINRHAGTRIGTGSSRVGNLPGASRDARVRCNGGVSVLHRNLHTNAGRNRGTDCLARLSYLRLADGRKSLAGMKLGKGVISPKIKRLFSAVFRY